MSSDVEPINNIIKSEDEQVFLKTLNKKGFFLEDKVWKIITESPFNIFTTRSSRSQVLDYDGRVEIDAFLENLMVSYIIECKRTDYSWFFPKAVERDNCLNLIWYNHRGKVEVKELQTSNFVTPYFDISILFNESGRLHCQRGSDVASTSYSDVHDASRQVLKEIDAYIANSEHKAKGVIPLIVTNTKLHTVDYSKSGLDNRGNLIDMPLIKEVPFLAYNISEIFKNDKMIDCYKGFTNNGQEVVPVKDYSHMKSVFICNVDSLVQTVNNINNLFKFRAQ